MAHYLVRRIATQIIEYSMMVDEVDPLFVGPVGPDAPAPTIGVPCEPGCELIEYEGDALLNAPHSATAVLRWNGVAPEWQEDATLDEKRMIKVVEMSQSCADAILAGFVSAALGAAYTYPAKPNDQANLTGSVVRSFYPNVNSEWTTPFWCRDADGVWAFRLHTAAQIQQVGDDAVVARLRCMGTNEQLAAQIMTASADELASIAWPP